MSQIKRILITGASGFIGQACLDDLKLSKFEIHAITRQHSNKEDNAIHWHEFDLLDNFNSIGGLLSEIRPTHLLHLAWDTTPASYLHSKLNLDWLSVSSKLLQSFRSFGGKRVVFCGTCAEYDWRYGLCQEDVTPTMSGTLYSASKVALHTVFRQMCKDSGISNAWIHPFYLFGPNEDKDRFVPKTILALLDKQKVTISNSHVVRDYIYIEDAAKAINKVLISEHGGSFNIARGEALTIKELVTTIAEECNASDLIHFEHSPKEMGEMDILIASKIKMNNKIGWRPNESLESAVIKTIDWWRLKHDLKNKK